MQHTLGSDSERVSTTATCETSCSSVLLLFGAGEDDSIGCESLLNFT